MSTGRVSCYLKSGISTSIDASGVMTKSMTWVCMDAEHSNDFLHWLSFEDAVREWAGNVGENWKKPVQTDTANVTEYTTDDATFLVASIDIATQGYTHIEVTFNCVQNSTVLTPISNVNVERSNNNEETRTIVYRLNVPLATDGKPKFDAINSHIVESGDVVDWAGSSFLIESSSYNAASSTQYDITIVAKDMAMLMLGLPVVNIDSYRQRTATVTWRMSKAVYDSTVLPDIGDALGDWFGDIEDKGDYVIDSIDTASDGVLGYNITLKAVDVHTRLVKRDATCTWETDKNRRTLTLTYKTDEQGVDEFYDLVGKENVKNGYKNQIVQSVSVTQAGVNDFDVVVELQDKDNAREFPTKNTETNLAKDVQIQMSQSYLQLTPEMCGWAKGLSGVGYYEVNNPPVATNTRDTTPQAMMDESYEWTYAKIATALNSGKLSAFERVVAVTLNNNKVYRAPFNTTFTADIVQNAVYKIHVMYYVYALPQILGSAFVPWSAYESLPIVPIAYGEDILHYRKDSYGHDAALPFSWCFKRIPYVDINVMFNVRGDVTKTFAKRYGTFYAEALKKLNMGSEVNLPYSWERVNAILQQARYANRSSTDPDPKVKFTDIIFTGVNIADIRDNNGSKWTTVAVHGMGIVSAYTWNAHYFAMGNNNG